MKSYLKKNSPVRGLASLLLLLFIISAMPSPGRSAERAYPGLTKAEANKAERRHVFTHLTDITVVKLYDHAKWWWKLWQAERYAIKNDPKPVTHIADVKMDGESALVELITRDGNFGWLRVSFPFTDSARLQAGLGNAPPDESAGGVIGLLRGESGVTVVGKDLMVEILREPFRVRITGPNGELLLDSPESERGLSGLQLGAGLTRQTFLLQDREAFAGGGEQFSGINHRGKVLIMDTDDAYQTKTGNTYIPVPFIISSRGYGLLVDSYRKVRFDLGKSKRGRMFFENPGPSINYTLFFGGPGDVVSRQSKVTGPSRLVPRWTLEPWLSRRTWLGWRYDVGPEHDVNRMMEEGIPLGVIMWENLTMTSHEGVDMRIHEELKPRAPELIDKWHGMGIKIVGYERCGMFYNTPETLSYYGFDEHPEYLVRHPDGTPYVGGIGGDKVYLDITNPEALEYAWDVAFRAFFSQEPDGSASFENMDLDGTKVDFGEFFPPDDVELIMHDRKPGMRLRYPVDFSEWYYDKIQQEREEDGGITWVRGAALGVQRTGIVWTGDRGRTFSQHRTTLYAGLNASASGVPVWGTDLAGYMGGGINAEEVYNRAVAMNCFLATFHDHGSAIAPWEQTERGIGIYRFYARLRYNLVPYLYSLVQKAHEDGTPVVRPMMFVCPENRECWDMDDQYMLGDALLVAPIVERGQNKRDLYLPDGDWVDFWTGESIKGDAVIERDAPIDVIPVFARDGWGIPIQANDALELGGGFEQTEKDDLNRGYLVFASDDFSIDRDWNTEDRWQTEDTLRGLAIKRSGGNVNITRATNGSSFVIIRGGETKEVFSMGKMLEKSGCDDLEGTGGPGWCIEGMETKIRLK